MPSRATDGDNAVAAVASAASVVSGKGKGKLVADEAMATSSAVPPCDKQESAAMQMLMDYSNGLISAPPSVAQCAQQEVKEAYLRIANVKDAMATSSTAAPKRVSFAAEAEIVEVPSLAASLHAELDEFL